MNKCCCGEGDSAPANQLSSSSCEAHSSELQPATTTSEAVVVVAAADETSEKAVFLDKETLSVGDAAHANGPSQNRVTTTTTEEEATTRAKLEEDQEVEDMTVSSEVKPDDKDSDMMAVDEKSVDAGDNSSGDDDETMLPVSEKEVWSGPRDVTSGVNAFAEENEAMNLCSKDRLVTPSSPVGLVLSSSNVTMSAKMRLKKQRLEAVAAAALRNSSGWSSHTDGLRQLAEAAELKQEEELMEVESSTPRGSSTPTGSTSSQTPSPVHATNLRPMAAFKTTNGLITARLTPLSEHEVTSSAHTQLLPTLQPTSNGANAGSTPTASPQLNNRLLYSGHLHHARHAAGPPTPSPDSAIHSAYYSPSQSPIQSRHMSGISSPFSHRTTPSLSRNNSDASQYGGSVSAGPASTVSDASPISPGQFSPTHSPVPGRNPQIRQPPPLLAFQNVFPSRPDDPRTSPGTQDSEPLMDSDDKPHLSAQPGISRQQLINSPCPVCGDKISGFHYGIFSCESCKGFFKRTVQNKKNYVCLRGAQCPVSIATRKKCPACRFDKCLKTGMKLEAIREDRTRGGRSTYQCSYTLPAGLCPSPSSSSSPVPPSTPAHIQLPSVPLPLRSCTEFESCETLISMDSNCNESSPEPPPASGNQTQPAQTQLPSKPPSKPNVPALLQEIMDVEHLWFSSLPNEAAGRSGNGHVTNSEETMVQTLADMADKRLYKLVKWCKSLPLFKNILIDDQIALLINAWCELLVFSCCFRSVSSPGIIRVSNDRILTLESARKFGIEKWVEKMLNFSDQLRRLKVDYFEYVSMKVIVLLTSDASSLKEAEHVRDSQEKVVQALQEYTYLNYPSMPSKFAEMLLRIPELHRVCQVGKEMLCPRQPSEGDPSGFNLLLELLRGDH